MVDAKKYDVPDMQPGSFVIEIVDEEGKPKAGARFRVVVSGNETIVETDINGLIKMPMVGSEIKLILAEEESVKSDPGGEGKTGEDFKESEASKTDEDYREEGQAPKKTSKEPFQSRVKFADIPPAGSYWPVRTSNQAQKEVAYAYKVDGKSKIEGVAGRRFLAERKNRYHVGVDLFADFDDPVVACEDGKIVNFYCFKFSKPEKQEDECKSGKATYALLIEHSNVVINYGEVAKDSLDREVAKDKKNKLKKGDIVKAGDVIGYIGRNPGGSSMLHFETYKKGTTKNAGWNKNEETPPSDLLDPTKYLLFLKEEVKSLN